jgi:hypothetical protein
LREILDRKWAVFTRYLPAEVAQNKKELLERLLQLNRIRNNVMHPVRGGLLTEDEFEFVYTLDSDLGTLALPEVKPVAHEKPSLDDNRPAASPATSAAAELVTRLSPTQESAPPQEFAATPQEAGGEDFIPSVKVG